MVDPLVRNAADEGQVKAAEVKEKLGRERETNDLAVLLAMPEGRRFIWRLLKRAKCFETIWEPSAKIHFNAGAQDFGFFILGEIEDANPQSLVQMMLEAKAEKEKASLKKER